MTEPLRSAVVTGASSGIGYAVAKQLLTDGWIVYAVARRPVSFEDVPAQLQEDRLRQISVDFLDHADLARVCGQLAAAITELDALVHCAGIIERGSLTELGVDGFDRLFSTNLRAPFALTVALVAQLRAAQGEVVFVNSTQGLVAGADAVGYASTKHGLRALADGLRMELSGKGVRVCSIYPGRTDTAGQKLVFEHEGRAYPSERLMKAETVADAIVKVINLSPDAEITDLTLRPARPL
jgi:NADP-dependent 3-hydroxy acid dehydrogenase YdfG